MEIIQNTLIEKLNICKAAGPHGILAKVIKDCSCIFFPIYNTIFHRGLMEGEIFQKWNEAHVRALYKKEANLSAPITGQSVLPPLYVNYLNH